MKTALRPCLVPCLLLLLAPALYGQTPSASEVLGRSMAYHDPHGVWGSYKGEFAVVAQYPERSERVSRIYMDQPASAFEIHMERDGVEKTLALTAGECRLTYQGKSEFSEEVAEKERLTCDRARMWRDYYTYLYGLPMKLKDPGTHLDPEVQHKTFKGKAYLALKVTYDAEVGKDTWYFYLDPETYAMEVYQFFHDESKNDGEYILLEGEVTLGGMRLPAKRSWYTNQENRFLGTDLLRL
ncbi:DUF6503 family protein [Robiginitalea sp. M366]|uniref:DUF6503 family protein n=1 Tax=Robiginitalea aestuariiviva TaxID=3036903 RepID=UPI00240DB37D|nr:DUF6503 family protein [Robiginitalea aestuariiviva]MDG1571313.1 DUF6503 family protein [Robiginitalea aestuariiviva]